MRDGKAGMPMGSYLEENGYQDDSDVLWVVLSELLAQFEPVTPEQAEAVSRAGASLAGAVAACNAREDLLHSEAVAGLFRFVSQAGSLTPLSVCEKVIRATQRPAELEFLAGYLKAQGLTDAAKEASARAEAKTAKAPDLSWVVEGATPSETEIRKALRELAECTNELCNAYGRRGWPLALANGAGE